jgi:hypothetical protein
MRAAGMSHTWPTDTKLGVQNTTFALQIAGCSTRVPVCGTKRVQQLLRGMLEIEPRHRQAAHRMDIRE